jgi:hypothetical protein
MKKPLVIIGIALFLLTIELSGCTNHNNIASKSNQEKILGLWTATIPNTPLIITMNFVTNMSYYESVNETRIWGTYTMTNTTLSLQSEGITHTVDYSFSNNDTILTLFETGDGGVFLTLTKR